MERETGRFGFKVTQGEFDNFRNNIFSKNKGLGDAVKISERDIQKEQPDLLKYVDKLAKHSKDENIFRYGFYLGYKLIPEQQRLIKLTQEDLNVYDTVTSLSNATDENVGKKTEKIFSELWEVEEKIENDSPSLKKWIDFIRRTIRSKNRDIEDSDSIFYYGLLLGIHPFYRRSKSIEIAKLDQIFETQPPKGIEETVEFKITNEVISETIKNDSETPENKKPYSIKMLEELEEKHNHFSELLINKCNELFLDLRSFEKAMGLVYSVIPEKYRNSPLTEEEIEKMFNILSDHFDSGIDEEKEQFSWEIDFSWINEKVDADSPEFSKWLMNESKKFEDPLLGLSFITGGWLTLIPFYQRAEERKKNNNFSPPNNP